MTGTGSAAHQALIRRFTVHYQADPRVLAIAVFGSVSTGVWHELSDVDLDVVVADDVTIDPAAEARAVFGPAAVIIVERGDSADVVLDSLAEVSVRWHPLRATSPNITATLTVATGTLPGAEITAALRGHRDQLRPDPADPMAALAAVIAEATSSVGLGPARHALLALLDLPQGAGKPARGAPAP